jgi:hypothetical protein
VSVLQNWDSSSAALRAHVATCNVAEGVRQVAAAAATTQTALNTAEITHARTCQASAIANKIDPGPHTDKIRLLSGGNS